MRLHDHGTHTHTHTHAHDFSKLIIFVVFHFICNTRRNFFVLDLIVLFVWSQKPIRSLIKWNFQRKYDFALFHSLFFFSGCLVFFPLTKIWVIVHYYLLFFNAWYIWSHKCVVWTLWTIFSRIFLVPFFSDNLSLLGILLIRGTGRKMKW